MNPAADPLSIADEMLSEGISMGLGHHTAEDQQLLGRTIRINGRDLVNFSSCSYLGLELDPRVIAGVVDAATRYGSQFSSSRIYVSAPGYDALEENLSQIFGGHAIAAPSTTLGHLAALPVIVAPSDVALLDHHVHNSVHMTAKQLTAAGTRVEVVRHHDLNQLEARIEALASSCEKVWFLVDGVCSMFGDIAPIADYRALLERHENLWLYVDDAHGMSWCGKNGRGYALRDAPLHPRMVVATSLNKAFGAAGGALVFPDAEMRRRVRTVGATLLFSGPIQPPMIGAALASAAIHASPEISRLQARFALHTQHCTNALRETELPTASDPISPVRFIEVGLPARARELAARLMKDGYYTNISSFPAVPMQRAGIRFTLTLHQRKEDLDGLVDAISRHHVTLQDSDLAPSRHRLRRGAPTNTPSIRPPASMHDLRPTHPPREYRVEYKTSIDELPAREWDRQLGDRGCFGSKALGVLERTFTNHEDETTRWGFHYFRVIDEAGVTRASTFFTDALWKADMLAPASVSDAVERERAADPLHLTHRVFSMGCLLSEGDHLYMDPSLGCVRDDEYQVVLAHLLTAVRKSAAEAQCTNIALRDLPDEDGALNAFLRTKGFVGIPLPDAMQLNISLDRASDFRNGLSRKSRYHQRRRVAPFDNHYRAEIFSRRDRSPTPQELDHFYSLYRNVKARSLALNTFDLPRNLFDEVMRDEHWEIIALYLNAGAPEDLPVAMGLCFVGKRHFAPLVMGLDYGFVEDYGLYRQCLRQTITRAYKHGARFIQLGMGADLEKRRFGAVPQERFMFLQAEDHYVFDAIAQMTIDQMRCVD
ncbi:MAG: 7-keto-8-aminopelargonate synthetase-like enzyme [Myxococcota bacterium]|jgi:7-keto-8-aminopelargonate synthetase-like enzyme